MSPARAALIDLDGTMMDTAPDLAAAVNRMRADFGLAALPRERVARFVGKGAEVLVHRALTDDPDGRADPAAFAAGRSAFQAHYHAVNGSEAVVFDGVPAAIDELRRQGWRVACVTNKPREFTVPLLERVGLAPGFDAIVAGDDVAHRKPHPAILLHACEVLGVAPAATTMIGDSVNDLLAGAAAGCRVILVECGYNEGEPVATLAGHPSLAVIVASVPAAVRWLVGELPAAG